MTSKETVKTWKWRAHKADLNQSKLAFDLSISPSALSEYISGKKNPSMATFDKIEGYLKGLGV